MSDEMLTCRRWIAARFDGVLDTTPPDPGLEVQANHDSIQKNGRFGKRLNIAGTGYERGLFCHAVSRIVVRLPQPAKTFRATVGVDSNEQTRGGQGSVVFVVIVAGREAFRSQVLREGMKGVPVEVDLAGARQFVIAVEDGGDGISCDQGDWADARVMLADGRTLRLDELPLPGSLAPLGPRPPFSLTYGGKRSSDFLGQWKLERATRKLDDARTERTLTYTDPDSGLVLRCVSVQYEGFPTVEWVLYLRNDGAKDTPIIEGLRALDILLRRGPNPEFTLHTTRGGIATPRDYEPESLKLDPQQVLRFAPHGGRSCDPVLPYFNLEAPVGEGLIIAIGWPGQWAAEFARDEGTGLRVTAGQERTRFVLHPGEEVRTPLVVLQFWRGDRTRSQNVWRRWMLAHNVPRPGGKLPQPMYCGTSGWATGWGGQTEENQSLLIDRYFERGLNLDYWWVDAGWYDVHGQDWFPTVGTWEVDRKRFPRGLRGVSDHARAKGAKFIVWFEPERVTPGSWLHDHHPDWLLTVPGQTNELLNMGDPAARAWLTEHVSTMISDDAIDVYRQDFNMEPLAYWRAADAPHRQGLAEIRYIEGHLAYWDELRRRHPNLLIDSCASGGRRNDLETLRRAVPLQRSDYTPEDCASQQCQTYGISSWIPFYGDGSLARTEYEFWSRACPSVFACYDTRQNDPAFPLLARLVRRWRSVAAYYLGDYYPLTPYSLEGTSPIAWQFDRPDVGEGMLQVFSRAGDCAVEAVRIRPKALDPGAQYAFATVDGRELKRGNGADLMKQGVSVALPSVPGAAVVVYQRQP